MSTLGNIVGIVLAGGQSRRMGGGDKCLQTLGGMPVLAHVLARLAAAVESERAMAVATSEAGLHPVVGLWPVSMSAALARSLGDGERRASHWVKTQAASEVFFDAVDVGGVRVDPFFNINRPEDLAAAQTLLKDLPAS